MKSGDSLGYSIHGVVVLNSMCCKYHCISFTTYTVQFPYETIHITIVIVKYKHVVTCFAEGCLFITLLCVKINNTNYPCILLRTSVIQQVDGF